MKFETAKKLLELGTTVAGSALEGKAPDPSALARQLVSLGLDLVPAEELTGYLTSEARSRVDAEIDGMIARGER